MTRNIEQEILTGIKEIKGGQGKKYNIDIPDDIKNIRARLDLSQAQFAALMGISVRTLQNWECSQRKPTGPALTLLRIAEKHPEVFANL